MTTGNELDGPTRLADVLPGLMVSIALTNERPEHIPLFLTWHDDDVVVMENNLTRKGVWALDPNRAPGEEVLRIEIEDVVGSLVMESSMGRLSTTEMELLTWLFGQWHRGEQVEEPWVRTSLRAISEAFATEWGGSRAHFIKEMLRRLHRVRFEAEVYDAKAGKKVTRMFNILDYVAITEPTEEHRLGRWTDENAPVVIKIGEFIHQQLRLGHYHRYSWRVLRGQLKTPLAKRLFLFVDGQRGWHVPEGWLYERKLDDRLFQTLGMSDTNRWRSIRRLRAALDEIRAVEPRYLRLELLADADGGLKLSRLKRDAGGPSRDGDASSPDPQFSGAPLDSD
jgi:hypothetical protein